MEQPTTTTTSSTVLAFTVSIAALIGFAGGASAQPDRASTEKGSDDISQINGTPVPVGDHHRYHYDYKRWNLSINPFSPMLDYISVAGSYAVHQNVAIRAEVTMGELNELGLSAPLYFRKVYSGFFFEPGVYSRSIGSDFDEDYRSSGYSMLVGWHHNFDSGLNVAYAFGLSKEQSHRSNDDYHYEPEVLPNGYFKVGYNF